MLIEINALTIREINRAEDTAKKIMHFLNYCASHSESKRSYKKVTRNSIYIVTYPTCQNQKKNQDRQIIIFSSKTEKSSK